MEPLPDIAEKVAAMRRDSQVCRGWVYVPPQRVHNLGGRIRTHPYTARVFGLPKTHVLRDTSPDGDDHLDFHLWALSFFTGMRLTATEAGFLDATPIEPGKLVDFNLSGRGLERAVGLAEAFWQANRTQRQRTRLFAAAVHALFLSQNPLYLQFEQFVWIYAALDACFALAKSARPPSRKGRVPHAKRVEWMCTLFGMTTPIWGDASALGGSDVANLRSATLHEALYMDAPLGFALRDVWMGRNLPLEMEALICRLLVALLGGGNADYVRTPIDTRQKHGLDLK